jgi:hypothetical protein
MKGNEHFGMGRNFLTGGARDNRINQSGQEAAMV